MAELGWNLGWTPMFRLFLLNALFSLEFKDLVSPVLLCSLQKGQTFSRLYETKHFIEFFPWGYDMEKVAWGQLGNAFPKCHTTPQS